MKRARDIREQIVGLMDKVEIEIESNVGDNDAIKKALTAGFFYHTAKIQRDGSYKVLKILYFTCTLISWCIYLHLVYRINYLQTYTNTFIRNALLVYTY